MTVVREMMDSLRWGTTYTRSRAHILTGVQVPRSHYFKAECGVYTRDSNRTRLLDTQVCKRCLKATEKYA